MLTLLKTRKGHPGRFYHHKDPQIFDLLQFSKKEMECKELFLSLKRKLQKLNDRYEKEPDPSKKNSFLTRKIILRKRTEDAVLQYRYTRRGRMRLFQEYVERLPVKKQDFYVAT